MYEELFSFLPKYVLLPQSWQQHVVWLHVFFKTGEFQHCVGAKYVGSVIDPSSRELPALRDLMWWCVSSVWPGVMSYERLTQSFYSTTPYCIAFNPCKTNQNKKKQPKPKQYLSADAVKPALSTTRT